MTNKTIVTTSLKNTGYYYDFAIATLYMTAEFEKNSNTYGTNEYHLMNRVLAKFPNATLKVYKSKTNTLITYELMEAFIRAMPDVSLLYEAKGIVLGTASLDGNTFTITYDTAKKHLPIGTHNLKVNYNGGNMTATFTTVTVTLNKANPVVTVPTPTATYGQTLADVSLPDGWTWNIPTDLVGDAGTQTHKATFTPADSDFYNTLNDVAVTVAVGKLTLTDVTLPENVTLDVYCATADAVIPHLPAEVSYTGADDKPYKLPITWTCAPYDSNPDAASSFTWTADLGANFEAASALTTGSITVRNGSSLPVSHSGKNAEITFGSACDVSELFTIDPYAGDASYAIVDGGTGAGTLNGSVLTITKAGTITIKLTTAANTVNGVPYAAGEATAILTVTKAKPAPAGTPDLGDVAPGTTLENVPTDAIENLFAPIEGTVTWNDPADTPVEPGKSYDWTFTPTDQDNYEPVSGSAVIIPAKTSYTVTVMGGTGSGEYEAGATVTITANTPAAGKQFAGWTSNDVTLTNANSATTTFVMHAKDVTVTANYTDRPVSIAYTVVYNANGGEGGMPNQYFNYGETKALLPNTFTREGYVFTGWNTKADGTGTAYADGQVVTMYNAVILYAQWKAEEKPVEPTPVPDPEVNPLVIIKHPADQIVAPGETAEFSILATGNGLAYQWYINRNDGLGWVKLHGATSAVHTTSAAELVFDGFQYACEVRDTQGNMARSSIAVLYVAAQPEIPETGDSTNLTLLCAMLFISCAGCLLLVTNRKRTSN